MRCDAIGNRKSKIKWKKWRGSLVNSAEEEIEEKECNSSKMALLEKKCQNIIRLCIVPLSIDHLALKDFHNFEEELFKSTCSFLNCDNFWNNNLKEVIINYLPILIIFINLKAQAVNEFV